MRRGWAIFGLVGALFLGVPSTAAQAAGREHPSGAARAHLAASNQVSVAAQEYVSDGQNGRPWNAYNLSAQAGGLIVGTPHALAVANGQVDIFGRSGNGDLFEIVNDGLGGHLWNDYDLSAAVGSGPISGTAAPVSNGIVHVYARGANGDLLEFVQDFANGRPWNAYDLSASAGGGGAVGGSPSALVAQNEIQVFVPGASGNLFGYITDGLAGHLWNAYDLSATAGVGQIAGAPAPVFYTVTDLVHVYARASNGELLEYVDDGARGRSWNAYDLSAATGAGALGNDPAVLFVPSLGLMHVYAQSADGDLFEFINDGAHGRLWNAYDLSVLAGGGSFVAGTPDAIYFSVNGTIHIYVRKANNDLVEFVSDDLGGRIWNAYDVTQAAAGPVLGTDPSVLQIGLFVHVYVGGPTPMGGVVISNLASVPNAAWDPGARVVALSFDDGPSVYTPQIVQILMEYRVPASFQVVGYEAAANVGLLTTEVADGFGLVNHTWDHVDLATLSASGWVGEVDGTDNLLAGVLHRPPDCLRPPYGYTNGSVVAQLAARGLGEFMWDVDPSDYLQPGTSVIVQRVLGALHPGAVIVMHDGGGNRSQTVAALPAIINGIRSAGYSIVEACG